MFKFLLVAAFLLPLIDESAANLSQTLRKSKGKLNMKDFIIIDLFFIKMNFVLLNLGGPLPLFSTIKFKVRY